MSDIKSYRVYVLELTPKGEYNPSLEKQLASVTKQFKAVYGVEPEEFLIGPIKKGEQVFVREGLVYIPIPDNKPSIVEGYEFVTGYDDTK